MIRPFARLLFLFLSALALGLAANDAAAAPVAEPAANTLSKAEKKAGFKLLFDGKTTKGWRGYNKKVVPGSWKVVDGLLTFEKIEADRGDIVTEEQYESFELLIDWRLTKDGNSGLMYHVQESEPKPYMTGPEMQMLDNGGHRDGKNPLTSAGAAYALYPPSKDATKPVGEWNSAKLLIDNGKAEQWLNGEKVVEYVKGSDDWKAKVAGSKFKAWANFGVPTKGHIDLQDHGDKVEFRNIKLRVIKAAKGSAKEAAKKPAKDTTKPAPCVRRTKS